MSHILHLLHFFASVALFLALKDHRKMHQKYLARILPIPLSRFHINTRKHTHSPLCHITNRNILGLEINVTGLSRIPLLSLAQKKQWQSASAFCNSAWTSPGKAAKDLIKYDSH